MRGVFVSPCSLKHLAREGLLLCCVLAGLLACAPWGASAAAANGKVPYEIDVCAQLTGMGMPGCFVLAFHGASVADANQMKFTVRRFDEAALELVGAAGGLSMIYVGRNDKGLASGPVTLQGRPIGRFTAVVIGEPAAIAPEAQPRAIHACETGGASPQRCADWSLQGDHYGAPGVRMTLEQFDATTAVLKGMDEARGLVTVYTGTRSGNDIRGSVRLPNSGAANAASAWTAALTMPAPPAPDPLDTPRNLELRKAIVGDSAERVAFETPDLPYGSEVKGINDNGVILASLTAPIGHRQSGFVQTTAVGDLVPAGLALLDHGHAIPLGGPLFERQANAFGPINQTTPIAINNRNEALIYQASNVANDPGEYFIYSPQTKIFREIGRSAMAMVGGVQQALFVGEIGGFNDKDEIVAVTAIGPVYGVPALGRPNAFEQPSEPARLTLMPPCHPGWGTHVHGITNDGRIGGYCGEAPAVPFIYSSGAYATFSYDGAQSIEVHAISNSGMAAGDFLPKKGGGIKRSVGFVWDGKRFTVVVLPGARDRMSGVFMSAVWAINAKGQMVGTSSDPKGNEVGFIATVKP